MADSLVIVAVPDENDRVWKVSSEKVPHLTLLYLGEDVAQVDNVDQIVEFVEHAASRMLRRFYLTVDRRGELGDDKADVLFFKTNRWDSKAVRDFRAALLQDSNIKTAYDSTKQFEGPWKPHLTLGYPATPAKPDQDDVSFYDVSFSKIAVWLGDYKGQEFTLKDTWDDVDETLNAVPMDVSMSDLQHYGVKGMKWGVHKHDEKRESMFDPVGHDLGSDLIKGIVWPLVPPLGLFAIPAQVRLGRSIVRGAETNATERNERKFTERASAQKNFVEIHNRSGARFNRDIGAINTKYAGKDLTKEPKAQKAYDAEVAKLMRDAYQESARSIGNKANTMHLDVEFKGNGEDFAIKARHGAPTPLTERAKVKHAAEDDEDFELFTLTGKIKRNAQGYIVGFEFTAPAQHTIDRGADFLEHYGVKGMKWGVRKAGPPLPVAPHATSKVPAGKYRKTKIETEGGENHDAHEDAIKVARAQAKLKKSGPAALSNTELRLVQERLNLERNAINLVRETGRLGKGRKFVKNVTGINTEVNSSVGAGLQSRTLYDQARKRR